MYGEGDSARGFEGVVFGIVAIDNDNDTTEIRYLRRWNLESSKCERCREELGFYLSWTVEGSREEEEDAMRCVGCTM